MILKLYAIHDTAVKEYLGVEAARTHGEAERKFKTNINEPQMGNLNKYPENFSLHHVGDYDTETGKIKPNAEPQHIISGLQCKESK